MIEESISVIKVRDMLIVTVPTDPSDNSLALLQEKVLFAMERYAARGVIVDVSQVTSLDSYFARMLAETASMVGIMGGKTIIAGIQPHVAITLTHLGLSLRGVLTALTVDRGMELLEDEAGRRKRR
jgi:rsbT antagonist protein RsbS